MNRLKIMYFETKSLLLLILRLAFQSRAMKEVCLLSTLILQKCNFSDVIRVEGKADKNALFLVL